MADFNEYKGVWVFCEQRQDASQLGSNIVALQHGACALLRSSARAH